MAIPPRSCERARAWVSLLLDDELSELEGAMLHAHVARCPACAAYHAQTVAFTQALRLAPFEPLPAPVALPPRRRSAVRFAQVGAAAAIVAVAAGLGSVMSLPGGDGVGVRPSLSPTADDLSVAYLDAPQGLPQHPPISFRPRLGLSSPRDDL